MTPERWKRLRELFETVSRLESADRAAYLATQCADDPELASEVFALCSDEESTQDEFVGRQLSLSIDGVSAGSRLDKYELLELVGRGGMGVVYRAERLDAYRQQVAVKIVNREEGGDRFLERFRQERQILASLEHPNIARLLDGGETPTGTPYLVMEYIQGHSLDVFCDSNHLSLRDRLQLIRTIGEAVAFAHDRHVVHRDLKPANVLVTTDGVPKVTDFGLAKRTDVVPDRDGQTKTGAVLGTPAYMSPEQAAGRGKQVGPATDVYALGAILYRVLTGRPPFEGSDPVSTILRVLGDEPVSLRTINPAVPRDVETICLKCLEKNPARRYANAGEFAADLRRYLANEPIQARPIGRMGRTVRWSRRHPALSAVGILSTLAVAVFVVLAVLFVVRLRGEQEQTRLAQVEVRRQQVRLSVNRALLHLEQGFLNRGVLELARALRAVHPEDADLERVIRLNLAAWSRMAPVSGIIPFDGTIQTLSFAPEGDCFATGTVDKVARIWSSEGNPLGPDLVHSDEVYGVALAPDRKTIVTGCRDGSVHCWDARSGQQLWKDHPESVHTRAVGFSPDGQFVAVGSGTIFESKGTVRIWRVENGTRIGKDMNHPFPVRSVAFSSDGRQLATCGEDTVVRIWDVEKGTSTALPAASVPCWLYQVAFSPDSRFVAAASRERFCWVWDLGVTPATVQKLEHTAGVHSVAFGRDSRSLATGCDSGGGEGAAYHWRFDERDPSGWIQDGNPVPLSGRGQAIAPGTANGGFVIASRYPQTRIWQVSGPERTPTFAHPQAVLSLAFSPDGLLLATSSPTEDDRFGLTRFWRIGENTEAWNPLRTPEPFARIGFGPNGSTFWGSEVRGTSFVWQKDRLADGGSLPPDTRIQFDGVVNTVTWSPDGQILLAAREDGRAVFRDAFGKPNGLPTLVHPDATYSIHFSPNGKRVVTACRDGKVRFWDAINGQLESTLAAHNGEVRSVAVSPDGRSVITGSWDKTAQVWDADRKTAIGRTLLHPAAVDSVTFSPDGILVATACGTAGVAGEVRFWDAKTGIPIGPPLLHRDRVHQVAFHPEGKWLGSTCNDRVARLWRVPSPIGGTAEELERLSQVKMGMTLSTTPNGSSDEALLMNLSASEWADQRGQIPPNRVAPKN